MLALPAVRVRHRSAAVYRWDGDAHSHSVTGVGNPCLSPASPAERSAGFFCASRDGWPERK